MKTLFIPIKSQNLAFYYERGLILSANLLRNRKEDVQSYFENNIVLSEEKWTDETDCSLEIVLDNLEYEKITQNFHLISKPIPISRICSIYFSNKEQKETTLWNINNSTAFIPENIVKIESNLNANLTLKEELQNIKEKKLETDYTNEIKKFNKILGGLAFMKFGGFSFMNYSHNYFVILSDINKTVKEQLNNTDIKFNLNLQGYLTGETQAKVLLQHLTNDINKNYVKKIAKEENINLKDDYVLDFNELDLKNPNAKVIYFLSIIATYGINGQKKLEDLVSDLFSRKINYNNEIVALLYGMYQGYKSLRHNIKFKAINKSIKFKLNSKLDFYIIESVYQYVFNNIKENTNFPYIDNWCPTSKFKVDNNNFIGYNILDQQIIYKKKDVQEDFWKKFYQNYLLQFFTKIEKTEKLKFVNIRELFKEKEIKTLFNYHKQFVLNEIKPTNNTQPIKPNTIEHQIIIPKKILESLKIKQLEDILDENDIKYNKTRKKAPYINLILKNQEKTATLFDKQ